MDGANYLDFEDNNDDDGDVGLPPAPVANDFFAAGTAKRNWAVQHML